MYRGHKPLKMYPTWEPSNHGEKHRIANKYGKATSPHGSGSQTPSNLPPPLDLDAHTIYSPAVASVPAEQCPTNRKRKLPAKVVVRAKAVRSKDRDMPPLPQPRPPQNLAVKAPPKRPKSPSSKRRRHKAKAKTPPRRVYISSSDEETSSAISCSESESDSEESTPKLRNPPHGVFRVVKHDQVLPAQPVQDDIIQAQHVHAGVVLSHPSADTVHQSVHVHDIVLQPEVQREEVLHAKLVPVNVQPRPVSREECKQRAYAEATTMFEAQTKVASPPKPIPVNGLYVLIMETADQWVPRKLVDDPDACMQYLCKQVKDGTIGKICGHAFGEWYLFGKARVCLVLQPYVLQLWHWHVLHLCDLHLWPWHVIHMQIVHFVLCSSILFFSLFFI